MSQRPRAGLKSPVGYHLSGSICSLQTRDHEAGDTELHLREKCNNRADREFPHGISIHAIGFTSIGEAFWGEGEEAPGFRKVTVVSPIWPSQIDPATQGEDLIPFANVGRNGEFGNGGENGLLNVCSLGHSRPLLQRSGFTRKCLATVIPSGERWKVGLRNSGSLGQGIGLAEGRKVFTHSHLGPACSVETCDEITPCQFCSAWYNSIGRAGQSVNLVPKAFAALQLDGLIVGTSLIAYTHFEGGSATWARRLVAGGANNDHLLLHILPSTCPRLPPPGFAHLAPYSHSFASVGSRSKAVKATPHTPRASWQVDRVDPSCLFHSVILLGLVRSAQWPPFYFAIRNVGSLRQEPAMCLTPSDVAARLIHSLVLTFARRVLCCPACPTSLAIRRTFLAHSSSRAIARSVPSSPHGGPPSGTVSLP
ncbi:hypothetical protein R1flu_001849 [Riccia fluitans]|uniref:Uncharacterized protein n=1 Tax=Riccia fluitans TaxID=41844 RepID=A0ABD1Y4F6_9MARC